MPRKLLQKDTAEKTTIVSSMKLKKVNNDGNQIKQTSFGKIIGIERHSMIRRYSINETSPRFFAVKVMSQKKLEVGRVKTGTCLNSQEYSKPRA